MPVTLLLHSGDRKESSFLIPRLVFSLDWFIIDKVVTLFYIWQGRIKIMDQTLWKKTFTNLTYRTIDITYWQSMWAVSEIDSRYNQSWEEGHPFFLVWLHKILMIHFYVIRQCAFLALVTFLSIKLQHFIWTFCANINLCLYPLCKYL